MNRRRAVARSFMEWSLGKQQDLRPALAEVTCPVLWLTGEKDEKFTSLAQEVIKYLPKGDLQVQPQVGHRVPWESPSEFHKELLAFLEKAP